MLGFVEEIVLLRLDEASGRFADLPLAAADVVVAGAAMMELALANRIDSDLDGLIIADPRPTGDDILDDVLARLVELAGPGAALDTAAALETIGDHAATYRQHALARLLAKGILREEEGRFRWMFHSRRYPVADDREQREVRARLRQLLLSEEIPDPRDIVLISLIEAADLLRLVLAPAEIAELGARVEQLSRLDLIGQAMAGAVAEIRFIVRHASPPLP
jgi:golgi phosphoprotein 3